MSYQNEVFKYIAEHQTQITNIANQLGVSRAAVAGSVAEEYNSFLDSESTNGVADYFVTREDHQSISQDYAFISNPANRNILLNPSLLDKLNHPTLNDVGYGNIKLYTAINLLNKYIVANPNSDPLGIKGFAQDYNKLATSLIDAKSDVTFKIAGLMVKQGQDLFSKELPNNWSSYGKDYKDALLVTYYNLGDEKVSSNINTFKLTNPFEEYSPRLGDGEAGGMAHIANANLLKTALDSSKIVLNEDGDLLLSDNQNQMTIKLFGSSSDVNLSKTNSLATDAAKLGSNKVSIKDSNNQEVAKFDVKQGDQTYVFNSSGLLKEESKFFNKDGEEVSQSDAIIKLEDTELGKLTVIRTDLSATLADNTTTTLGTFLNTIESSSKAFDNFMSSGFSSITKKLFGVESNSQGLAAEIAFSLATGQNLEEIATKIALREILISPAFDKIAFELNDVFTDSEELGALRESLLSTQDGTEQLNILTQRLGSENEALAAIDFQKLQSSPMFNAVKGGIIQFAVITAIDQIDGGDKMNSEEYAEAAAQIIAQKAVTLGVSHYFGTKATALTPATITPGGFGVEVGVGHLASAAVRDLFADDHMNSHQWQSTTMTAAAMGATAFAIGSAAIAMGLIQAGALLGPVGFAIGIVAAIIVTQVFGGKEYGAGEYPDPYSYLKIEAKEDGTGNKIIGIESEGVVAIAREYYHDDLYGNSGSDNLIGKSGTNTIYGYAGNDHLEGRGDVDLLVGGDGDDEEFGGNGDDQIYGGNGSDNLFGGNGNDQIVGGDGNDFIQGGNGDDQIMGEAGNDIIQGNDGSDVILGGAGNDTIDGNEGDDSILGEDGDDLIIAGAGSDIIDGGAGIDIIYGNEGNDNIRGGDNNDEIYGNSGVDIIYGDAGNDLINSGADNDLTFGGLGNDIIYGAEGDDTISGELGNDYLIGAEGIDTIDGGAGDDVLFGGADNDSITTGIGNDTIIFRSGDGSDTIDETDTITNYSIDEVGDDTIYLSDLTSKLSDNATNRVVLTKSGDDLVIKFKDDSGTLTTDQITIKNQLSGDGEIVKKIEFSDSYKIDLTALTVAGDGSISYNLETYENIDTTIQTELALGYNDSMQNIEDQTNPDSTYLTNSYNSSGEQETIDSEKYNEMQWRSHKEKRSVFGGHYTVWTKYYEKNLSGASGNDRIVGHWWSENIYGGAGDDQLHGGDGNDNLYGGEGADILHGGAGNDKAYGEAGEDLIYGGTGNDFISGGADNDQIYGNSGDDEINGDGNLVAIAAAPRKWSFVHGIRGKQSFIVSSPDSVGDDYIEGNDGDDKISDFSGHNIIIAGSGNDIINLGNGDDYIEGGDGSDLVDAGDGNNLIYGNDGSDSITTGVGNDSIYGQEGFDLINAGAGDDYISGGANDDLINGEAGQDTIYGDTGIDQISGGEGNDYIYGGAGADLLNGDAGNDTIRGGDSDDLIDGGAGDDSIFGESGSDKIFGKAGNDAINGGIGGDVLEGGQGNDTILGAQGNDILVDGAGSDTLDGGLDSDIIILTQEIDENGNTTPSASVDTIKNFNKDEDKIILKVSYKTPISFLDVQEAMVQDGADATISLDNGQTIIVKNTNVSDITESNFQIGLSGGSNNDILFGTDGEDVVFGDEGDDKIYGGEGNDELWGGAGSDELYGEGGDDILRYEADGKYQDSGTAIYSDEIARYWGYTHRYIHPAHYFEEERYYTYKSNNGYVSNVVSENDDVFVRGYNLVNLGEKTRYVISTDGSRAKNENPGHPWYYGIKRVTKIEFNYEQSYEYSVKNFHTSQLTDITGYNRTFDKFDGGAGSNVILMTEGNDVLALDDATSAAGSNAAGTSNSARVKDISVIHAGAGDDVINFSTQKYSYTDSVVYGGTGNDKLWLSSGNDQIFGQEGNDEIYSAAGNDELNGGSGDDAIYGGTGNDNLEGGAGANQLFGEDGDDTFIAGSGADIISGGSGFDTVSYVNSVSAVTVNLATNSVSGGGAGNDAANDSISSIENVTGSAFNDTLTGNSSTNTINGGSGDDNLSGGLASDTYIYNSNSGTDTITEISSDLDYIQFGAGISASDLTFVIDGNDLQIQVGDSASNKLILKNQTLTTNRIEYLKFDEGSQIGTLSVDDSSNLVAISEKFFIASEDVELAISNPLNESVVERRRFESLTALYGTFVFDEALNQFTYKSSANFHGIDEVELVEEDGTRSKFTVFVNGVNDAPTFSILGDIPNKEVKVEEEWSVNLKDYFFDADGDDLTLSLRLQGFDNLPDWINFNSETGIVSGKIGRDGKLNFTVTATDPSGANLLDNFRISVTRNITDDIRPTTPVVQVIGTDAADIITATPESSDIISGGAGDDTINYTKDNDWIESSDGSYYIAWNVYSGDEITVTGKQRSFDAFDGGDGYDKLNLTNQNDVIFLDDAIVSNVGDIAKLASIEEIDAGDGDDVIDLTSLTFGYDDVVLNGGNGDDALWGNDGDDTINGDEGEDNLQGGKGNDTINGGIGNDTIKGYDGNDQINGGAGFDVMIGGDGSDQFIFTDKADSIGSFANLSATDIISDFVQNEDQIDLSALGFDSITQGQGSNSSADGLEFYFKDGYTIIDDPNSNFAVKLVGEIQLGASDFMF